MTKEEFINTTKARKGMGDIEYGKWIVSHPSFPAIVVRYCYSALEAKETAYIKYKKQNQ